MQLALSFDACVPLAPQHDFPPAKDELAANTPAANNAKVVLIMHLRQHELGNVQLVPVPTEVESYLQGFHLLLLTPAFSPVDSSSNAVASTGAMRKPLKPLVSR